MDLYTLAIVGIFVWFHWFGDFVLQTDEMANRKSFDGRALRKHVSVYAITMLAPTILFLRPIQWAFLFWCFVWVTHWITDFVTSKMTARLWKMGHRHEFFVMIGFDQALHASQIIIGLVIFLS